MEHISTNIITVGEGNDSGSPKNWVIGSIEFAKLKIVLSQMLIRYFSTIKRF